MRKFLCLIIFVFLVINTRAQWKQVSLNYRYLQQPGFFTPLAMHFSDTSSGFILNTGLLLQYKNYAWQIENSGPEEEFSYINIFTVNPRNTFLCGYDGKFARFDGSSLEVLFQLPGTETSTPVLTTIYMADSAHGWVAGDNGVLLKIEGNTYTEQNLDPAFNFKDIQFDRPGHGWMIGYQQAEAGNMGVVFEYSNNQWSFHSYVDEALYDIEFSSEDKGFIAGEHDIFRYNKEENRWEEENIQNYYHQFHISMFSDFYGMSVSDNSTNMVYQQGQWSLGPTADVSDLVSIKLTGAGKGWGISQTGLNRPFDLNEGKVQLLNNAEWQSYSLDYLDTIKILPVDFAITSIAAIDRKNTWFDGHYLKLPDDKVWPDTIPVLSNDSFCYVSKMFSRNFGLGLNGNLEEWDGNYWQDKVLDTPNPDSSISNIALHVFDDTTGYIGRQILVWESGSIRNAISHYDYKTNSLDNTAYLDTRSISAIHFSDRQNGWCVGDSGLIAKFENGSWQVLPPVTNKRINKVFTNSAGNAWAAGDNGTLLKYDGTGWSVQPLPTEQHLSCIYFTDPEHGWISGDSGLIFRYNGTAWLRDTTITTVNLYTIFMVDSAFGFAGGDNGTVLQFSKPVPVIQEPPVRRFCENGDTYFSYNLPGTANYVYQWQVDTGNGFENITDNEIFSGAFADTLKLTSIPSGFYGYRFRCIASYEGVDSISEVEVLKFINRWTGEADNTWENPNNWSCGALPGENTDVNIESGDIILSSPAYIRSLRLAPGVNINITENGALHILH